MKIRHKSGQFSWLANAPPNRVRKFFTEMEQLIADAPGMGLACVIDRPGYHNRYHEKHGHRRWHLCKTAFSILCERAAKYASMHDSRVVVYVEETDKKCDGRIKRYFEELRAEGMPFAQASSEKYGALTAEELRFRLLDLKFKRKSSPPLQLADLFLYPMCRSGYDELYRPLKFMRDHRKLLDCHLPEDAIPTTGIKYSCFD